MLFLLVSAVLFRGVMLAQPTDSSARVFRPIENYTVQAKFGDRDSTMHLLLIKLLFPGYTRVHLLQFGDYAADTVIKVFTGDSVLYVADLAGNRLAECPITSASVSLGSSAVEFPSQIPDKYKEDVIPNLDRFIGKLRAFLNNECEGLYQSQELNNITLVNTAYYKFIYDAKEKVNGEISFFISYTYIQGKKILYRVSYNTRENKPQDKKPRPASEPVEKAAAEKINNLIQSLK